jgi:hypothetical protein
LSNTKTFDQSELIRLALAGLDAQIAELQEKRAQLTALTNPQSTGSEVKAATPTTKGGKMSDEARAKISAAATARWARVRKAQAEAAKSATAAKKVPAKKKSVKAQAVAAKGKKSPAKKGKSKPVISAAKAEPVKAAA